MRHLIPAAAALALLAPLAVTAPATTAPAVPVRTELAAPVEAVHTQPAYAVVARVDRADVIARRGTVRVTGRVRPRAPGQVVVLQQRLEGARRWRETDRARIDRDGTFRLRDRPSRAGIRSYRVLKPAGRGLRAGRSRSLEVRVWAWRPLTEVPAGGHPGVLFAQDAHLGARTYPGSIVLETPGNPGYVEYTIGNRCSKLRATYALTDESATGTWGVVKLTLDGTTVAEYPIDVGTVMRDYVTDVRDVFRFRIDLSATLQPGGWTAVGSPEVLCLG